MLVPIRPAREAPESAPLAAPSPRPSGRRGALARSLPGHDPRRVRRDHVIMLGHKPTIAAHSGRAPHPCRVTAHRGQIASASVIVTRGG
jgi:hypothetical protein